MFNPLDQTHIDRLSVAIEFSRRRLQPFRENRMQLLKQFVGAHYSWSGAPQRVPLNMLQLAHNIYLRQLVARAPRAMVSSKQGDLKPIAADMQAWMDRATVGMRLGESLRICVSNALFSLGIMKVGEAHVGDLDILGTTQHVGQPFAEPVDLDDWVHDITAKRYDQIAFAGNRYRMPISWVKSNPLFDPVEREKVSPQYKFAYNEMGDLRSTTLSQSTMQGYDAEVEEQCELWDIWIPKEKIVLTIPYHDSATGGFSTSKPLRIVNWTGPDQGPFILLSFCDVPNNVMPAAPMQNLIDLHEGINLSWRKLLRQMERQKTILGFMGSATEDAERINRASDGDAVRQDMPDRSKEMSLGGMKQENILAAVQMKNDFVYQAGNLDSLGGLSPQAGTLGQDELLNKNSAAQVAEMQDRTINFVQDIYTHLAWHWWTNPIITYDAVRQVAGVDIPVSITPQMRSTPFSKLDFKIDPYSMQHSTPSTRLAGIMQILTQILLPSMPGLQQAGISIQWQKLLDVIGKYGDFPDLPDIIQQGPPPDMQGPTQDAQATVEEMTKMPSVTTRHNVRTNRPGMTRQGQSDVMAQLMAGGGQPAQAAANGRPVG